MDTIKDVKQIGLKAAGRSERIRFLKGGRLTRDQAIRAQCYDCMGGYSDGPGDCEIETCSLYGFHPYRHKHNGNHMSP
jgi:hypothetical protein